MSSQHFFVAPEVGEGRETSFGVVNKITNEIIFVIIDLTTCQLDVRFVLNHHITSRNVRLSSH
jgi:hypothetical protein